MEDSPVLKALVQKAKGMNLFKSMLERQVSVTPVVANEEESEPIDVQVMSSCVKKHVNLDLSMVYEGVYGTVGLNNKLNSGTCI